MRKISVIFGTRPEAIKLGPLILKLKGCAEYDVGVCVTGQHNEMLYQVLEVFDIVPDRDLELMRPEQTLTSLTCCAVEGLNEHIQEQQPDIVFVQGDTTTVFAAALASFYNRIPVAHVEAGLRTWNKFSPYPEEINRVFATRLADLHFAPTETSRKNLLRENVEPERIFVTGNTVIDALHMAVRKVSERHVEIPGVPEEILRSNCRIVAITGHRRENFGEGFRNICRAIRKLAERFGDTSFIYPVHLNPNVQRPVYKMLDGLENVRLIRPLGYLPFVRLLDSSTIVLTDSGGVQEEAPSLGKPVLVMRDTTERPEAVDAGTVRLVGADADAIVEGVSELITNKDLYESMANAVNPYGDGRACERIVEALRSFFAK